MKTDQSSSLDTRKDSKESPPWVDKQVLIAPGKTLDVRFYGRRRAVGVSPLVVHFHGGAFVGGRWRAAPAWPTCWPMPVR
ncbi:hypothetical protein LP417_02875 [Polaromonas sp. P1-6]|nr:hypothetical protein LP417_02875 [Polaromonas sp. P1-6]